MAGQTIGEFIEEHVNRGKSPEAIVGEAITHNVIEPNLQNSTQVREMAMNGDENWGLKALTKAATLGWEVIFGAATQARENNGIIRELGVQKRERQALLSLARWLARTEHQSLADQVTAIVDAARPFSDGWDIVTGLAVDADALFSIDALLDSHIQTQSFNAER